MDLNAIVLALIGGGAVGFIEFLIRRHDAKSHKDDEILTRTDSIDKTLTTLSAKVDVVDSANHSLAVKIDTVDSKLSALEHKVDIVDHKGDERNAVLARVRVLSFMDELLEGRRHSKDRFDQVMTDIDFYEKYCVEHPEFKNNQTASTIQHIKSVYNERLAKHDFL